MSEHILKFLLSELATVRLLCQKCEGIIEVPVDKLRRQMHCPLCQDEFALSNSNPLRDLAVAIADVAGLKDRVLVEFVLPDEPRKD